jgi:hypothetical protein
LTPKSDSSKIKPEAVALVRKENLYEILGLDRKAPLPLIQTQFQTLESFWNNIQKQSPIEAELKLIEIRYAYSILSNEIEKKKYDESLDFSFVLLDGKPKDEDIEEAYGVYRNNHSKSYQSIFKEFNEFKIELGATLWMLKTTTMYLLLSLFCYSGLILLLAHFEITVAGGIFVPTYFALCFLGYVLFRNYYQIPNLKKRKAKLYETNL